MKCKCKGKLNDNCNFSRHYDINVKWQSWQEGSGDHKLIWKSISWKGEIEESTDKVPRDDEFERLFEELLDPSDQPTQEDSGDSAPYIPILDDPITPLEVQDAIKLSKVKSYVGVSPGLLKWLPMTFIAVIAHVLNLVFYTSTYPSWWLYTNIKTIFKGGRKLLYGYYRGIQIMNTLAKVCNCILNLRITDGSI